MFRTLFVQAKATTGASAFTHAGSKEQGRIAILGSGWAGFQVALHLRKDLPVTVVSPVNHFVFTPLLPSTAVGTLEFRCIQEPVRAILSRNGEYLQAKAHSIDPARKKIVCETAHKDIFEIDYDKLIIAVGVKTNTFGIESISEGNGIFFLKQLRHARAIRNNTIDNFEKAAIPTVSEAERRRLLSFVVVGGGPTSCEFVAELHGKDRKQIYSVCALLSSHGCLTFFGGRLSQTGFESSIQRPPSIRHNNSCRSWTGPFGPI
jgi:NADH dehydrogenase/NADH:ubiquinone reductase (non-electrogenic)